MLLLTPRRIAIAIGAALLAAGIYSAPLVFPWALRQVATFWVYVLTAAAAFWYGWLTYLLLRKEQTPVLVMSYEDASTVFRNFGRGAALNVTLLDTKGRTVARAKDLGPDKSYSTSTAIRWTLEHGRYVFYQDIFGRWYATKCLGQGVTQAQSSTVSNAFVGRVYSPPPEARRAALVRDAVEHWVQLNRSWDPRNWVRRASYYVRKLRAEKRIIKSIREAIAAGRLGELFTAAEVAQATQIERAVIDRFLGNHVPGNVDQERAYFVQAEAERFRLC